MFSRENITDALRFWEIARIPYNVVLVGIVAALFLPFLDHFGPNAWGYFLSPGMLALAILANALYCLVYPIDLFVQASDFRPQRSIWRLVIWLAGIGLAGAITWDAVESVIGAALF